MSQETLQNCRIDHPANEKDVSLGIDIWQLEITKVTDAEQRALGNFFFQGHGSVTLI